MQILLDTEFSNHGISFDERMAIFRLFHDDEELGVVVEPFSAGLASEGYVQ